MVSKPFKRGFTLIEMVFVLVILSLSAMVVVPRIGGSLDFLQTRNALRSSAAIMRKARIEAVFRRENMMLAVDPDQGLLTLSRESDDSDADSNEGEEQVAQKEKGPAGNSEKPFYPLTVRLPDTLKITEVDAGVFSSNQRDAYKIVFYPLGSSSGGEIFFEDSKGNRHVLRVQGINGKVRLLQDDTDR